ncbi:MAG: DUF374 domain-containing protein [bacterium]
MLAKIKDFFYIVSYSFCGYLMYLLLITIDSTLRISYVGKENVEKIKVQGKNVLYAIWHQANFIPGYTHRKQGIAVLTTSMWRGEMVSVVVWRSGFKAYQIPDEVNSFKGLQAVLQMIKEIKKGYDGAVAVDGPLGPLHKAKPGIFSMAEKANVPIIPIGISSRWKINLRYRWDNYFIPLPFSKAALVYGEPIWIEKPLLGSELEVALLKIEEQLKTLTSEAEKICRQ